MNLLKKFPYRLIIFLLALSFTSSFVNSFIHNMEPIEIALTYISWSVDAITLILLLAYVFVNRSLEFFSIMLSICEIIIPCAIALILWLTEGTDRGQSFIYDIPLLGSFTDVLSIITIFGFMTIYGMEIGLALGIIHRQKKLTWVSIYLIVLALLTFYPMSWVIGWILD